MNRISFLILALSPLLSFTKLNRVETGSLIIQVENVQSIKGSLRIGIYNTEASYDDEDHPYSWKVQKVESKGRISVVVNDLPFGKYGIALLHDLNENDKMDFNLFGIPKEPYGFSMKTTKWKKPSFSEVQFDFTTDQQSVKVELIEW
jgi:uncharacterized protein (DUF2141 family)